MIRPDPEWNPGGMGDLSMGSDRPTVTIADALRLQEQDSRPTPLTPDEVHDYAIASLLVTRGLARRDKLRVLTKMRRLLG